MAYLGIGIAFAFGLLIGNAMGATVPILLVAGLSTLQLVGNVLTTRGSRSSGEGTVPSGWRAVEQELSRARRMERTFSLARLTPRHAVAPHLQEGVLRELRRAIRDIDAGWWEGEHIFLLLSETSAAAVRPLITRLGLTVPSWRFRWFVAEFPRDGLTVPALMASLAANESAQPAHL